MWNLDNQAIDLDYEIFLFIFCIKWNSLYRQFAYCFSFSVIGVYLWNHCFHFDLTLINFFAFQQTLNNVYVFLTEYWKITFSEIFSYFINYGNTLLRKVSKVIFDNKVLLNLYLPLGAFSEWLKYFFIIKMEKVFLIFIIIFSKINHWNSIIIILLLYISMSIFHYNNFRIIHSRLNILSYFRNPLPSILSFVSWSVSLLNTISRTDLVIWGPLNHLNLYKLSSSSQPSSLTTNSAKYHINNTHSQTVLI